MEEKYERISEFLESCNALMECDYRMAGGKIREILQKIARSRELTELFTAVTKGFHYAAARRDYLRYPAAPGTSRGVAYLPAERKDVLAFVFCLMVEFDAGTMELDDFLLRYFYVDGSYTASFLVFTDRVVKPFRDIVADCFPALSKAEPHADAPAEDVFACVPQMLSAERSRISVYALGEEGEAAAALLFGGLSSAAEKRDADAFMAVLAGYKYFLRAFSIEESRELFAFAASL